jgi:hypothetical protein
MLHLTRVVGESIVTNDELQVVVLEVSESHVQLALTSVAHAPFEFVFAWPQGGDDDAGFIARYIRSVDGKQSD